MQWSPKHVAVWNAARLMLNTDMHNKQVAQKMWDNKKFAGRPDAWIHRLCLLPPLIGKDCPVWF